ncbi:MAG: zinc ribbon domain-containing protein [Oscillospiraceae bacterium]|nr:zinc ribbon domain-containing protein [Oscillospiraceae bacterium]
MYCPQCGTQKPPHAAFCPECGLKAPVQSAHAYPQVPYYAHQHAMPQHHPYQQIGGVLRWLQVGMIIVIIMVPITFMQSLFDFLASGDIHLIFQFFLSAGTSAFYIVCLAMLLRRKPKFLRMFELYFIVNLGSTVLRNLLWPPDPELVIFSSLPVLLTFSVIVVGAWLLYFVRSVRVRTYMGSDEYIRQSIFLKRVKPPQPAVPDDSDEIHHT